MISRIKANSHLAVLLAVYIIYASIFIIRTSHNVDGERHFVLFDDAMISMQYAKNLYQGNGLVWDPGGDRVEGYSNFLWVMIMAVPHVLGLSLAKTSLFIQLLGMICLLFSGVAAYLVTGLLTKDNKIVQFCAALLTLFYLPLNYWSLMGMEVSLIALLMAWSIYFIIGSNEKVDPKIYGIYAILLLLRPDTIIFVILAAAYTRMFFEEKKKNLIITLSVVALVVGGLTVFRLIYYGEFLPNTYYLKMTGYPAILRILHGFWVLFATFAGAKVIPFLIPLVAAFFIRKKEYWLIVSVFIVQCAYSVYVGGDAWEGVIGANRFISSSLPVYFSAVAAGSYYLTGKYFPRINNRVVFTGSMVVILLLMNSYNGMHSLKQFVLADKQQHIDANYGKLIRAMLINHVTKKGARIGVVWAGIVPYFSDRNYYDILGKNEKAIAKSPMRMPSADMTLVQKIRFFYPGHLKDCFSAGLVPESIDFITDVMPDNEGFLKFVKSDYYYLPMMVFIKKDSAYIDFDKLDELIESSKQ